MIKATNTADIDEQKQAFYELQQYENDTLFVIPLYHQQLFVVESDRLDRKGAPIGNMQFFYDWRLIDWEIAPDNKGNHTLYSSGGPVEFFETVFVNPAFFMYQKFLFDRLVVADENLTPYKPQLASEYHVSEDGLTIEFVLRDGIYWHDGQPITAEDVEFTVEYSARVPQLNAVAAQTYASLEGYEEFVSGQADGISGIVIDGNKITFKFATVDPNALLTFAVAAPAQAPLGRHRSSAGPAGCLLAGTGWFWPLQDRRGTDEQLLHLRALGRLLIREQATSSASSSIPAAKAILTS